MEYPKTENLYARDPETKKSGPDQGFKLPAVGQIAKWLVTEKVDGMNMRVVWRPDTDFGDVQILGRTDRAQIPGDLMAHMRERFTPESLGGSFGTYGAEEIELPESVILFGEGYGAGIQAGGHYRPDKAFVLFDVVVDGHWLSFDNVVDVARRLGVPTVPVLCTDCSVADIRWLVEKRVSDLTDPDHVEGVVARTDPYLFDGRGRLVKFKYKARDIN